MLIHPPWRTLAEEILKAKDPKLYRALKKGGTLENHLDDKVEHARTTYEHLAKKLAEGRPEFESWAIQAAEELVIHDILDPTT
jgi:hypothetical protein